MAVLNNVELSWVKIQQPDEYLGKKSWQCTAKVSKAQAKKLIAEGAKPKKGTKDEFDFKRNCSWPSGDPQKQPKVVDGSKNPMDCLLGNGTKANIQYQSVPVTNQFGSFVLFDLCAIQVLSLVEFGVEDGGEFSSDDEDTSEFDSGPKDAEGSQDPF